ncbi:unnamed protein product [Linum trigynum]|uniref:LOB domain-containing protein n=1 Tax=Linum trigynum TaxID=586398 RepID=A0AAV2DSK5_9ROSI
MSITTHTTNNTTTTTTTISLATSNTSYNKTNVIKNRIVGGNNNNNSSSSNGTSPACAACKYQRRKCAPDCVLAPYFPHDRQRQFLNAHKLFGVRKITKIIENLSTKAEKDEAMRAIIIQSDVRASDPVGGCYRIVRELQRQIEYGEAELGLVLHQLAICQQQHQQQEHQQQQQDPQQQSTVESNIDSAAMMAVGCLDVYSDPMLLQFHCGQQQLQQQQADDQQEEQEQQQHQHHYHHHHHHHHQNHEQLHQHHHGYVVQETLQDGASVNSWGMAVGG